MSDGPIILRRRPLTVEAWRITEDNVTDVAEWSGGIVLRGGLNGVAIHTDTDDLVHAKPGDWVIRGPFGDFYPAADRVVFASYEAVVGAASQ